MYDEFGLKENPFERVLAQDPNDPDFVLVDVSIDGETLKDLRLINILNTFINRLRNGNEGRRGLIITGDFGSGKTQALNYIIRNLEEEFNPKYVNIGKRLREIRSKYEKQKDLKKAILGVSIGGLVPEIPEELEELGRIMNNNKIIILLDQFDDIRFLGIKSSEEIVEFMRELTQLVDIITEKRYDCAITIGIHTGLYEQIKGTLGDWFIDRFDIIKFKDDLSEEEAMNIIKERVKRKRIKNPEELYPSIDLSKAGRELYPFNIGAVRAILDIWREGTKRTIREFLQLCSKVYNECKGRVDIIDYKTANEAIHRYYYLWEELIEEWKKRRDRHKILIYALYHTIDFARDEINIVDVIPEQRIENVRLDVYIIKESEEIDIEIELSQPSEHKYSNIKSLINNGRISKVIVIGTRERASSVISTKKLMTNLKIKHDYLIIDEKPTKLGRLLAFASLSPLIDFPEDESARDELRRSLSGTEAATVLNHIGLIDKI